MGGQDGNNKQKERKTLLQWGKY